MGELERDFELPRSAAEQEFRNDRSERETAGARRGCAEQRGDREDEKPADWSRCDRRENSVVAVRFRYRTGGVAEIETGRRTRQGDYGDGDGAVGIRAATGTQGSGVRGCKSSQRDADRPGIDVCGFVG